MFGKLFRRGLIVWQTISEVKSFDKLFLRPNSLCKQFEHVLSNSKHPGSSARDPRLIPEVACRVPHPPAHTPSARSMLAPAACLRLQHACGQGSMHGSMHGVLAAGSLQGTRARDSALPGPGRRAKERTPGRPRRVAASTAQSGGGRDRATTIRGRTGRPRSGRGHDDEGRDESGRDRGNRDGDGRDGGDGVG